MTFQEGLRRAFDTVTKIQAALLEAHMINDSFSANDLKLVNNEDQFHNDAVEDDCDSASSNTHSSASELDASQLIDGNPESESMNIGVAADVVHSTPIAADASPPAAATSKRRRSVPPKRFGDYDVSLLDCQKRKSGAGTSMSAHSIQIFVHAHKQSAPIHTHNVNKHAYAPIMQLYESFLACPYKSS